MTGSTHSSWIGLALRRDVVRRGLKVGGVVGSVLVAINQGDLLIGGVVTAEMLWKIPMTYCVPYCVSTYASVQAIRSGDDATIGGPPAA